MDDSERQLDELLAGHERRKQDETRRQVQQALRLEAGRKAGAEHLRRHVVRSARTVVERLKESGHEVAYQEFLDAYPPGVRIHLWPKSGPLDDGEAKRATLEFVWGDPRADMLCVRRWGRDGLGHVQEQGAARPKAIDELWTREQLLTFVREVLENS